MPTTLERIARISTTPPSRPLADKESMRTARVSHPPLGAIRMIARRRIPPTRFLLTVSVANQAVTLWEKSRSSIRSKQKGSVPQYEFRERYIASTSRFGIGQRINSNRTPLGLHRIARKIGGDQPEGTVFKARVPTGKLSDMPNATIVHRILWLAGLEPGLNRGGEVDTFRRYIYIHGFGDETTLGRPMSCGCIHLGAADLIPLYERVPRGTLVWIGRK